MPAQPYATGAVHVFVRALVSGPITYFGTCESMPQDSRNNEYEMLMNDISGSKVPLDLAWEAQSAQIGLVMTRWDEVVAQTLTSAPISVVDGSWPWESVGTLMGLEGFYTEIWLTYTFGGALANKAAYTGNGLTSGRHYLQAVLWSPQTDETGTKPMKRHFMFYAWPKLVIGGTKPRFTLYDTNMTGISRSLIT